MLTFFLIFILTIKLTTASSIGLLYRGGSTSIDPYRILQISKSASLDEIRKSYKQLCKKYHPDKHSNALVNERKIFEAQFKNLQHAYSLIGNKNARERYDRVCSESNKGNRGKDTCNHTHKKNRYSHPLFGQNYYFNDNTRPFYVNGMDISPLFTPMGFLYRHHEAKKSIFIKNVDVPLEELYMGVANKCFTVKKITLWGRYRAALRGNIFGIVVFQSFLTSFPVLIRSGWVLSSLIFFTLMHIGLPTPTKLDYKVNILRGWKGGTKLTFSEPNMDIVFIIREKSHQRYERKKNDLLSSVRVGQAQAKKGCTILLAPLCKTELPIEVIIKPEQINEDGQIVVIKGRGWPRRISSKIKQRGNLLVIIKLVSNRESEINEQK